MSTLVITRLATSTTIDRTATPIVVSRQHTGVMGPTGPTGPPGTQPTYTRTGILDTITGTTRLYIEESSTIARVRAAVGTPPQGQGVIAAVNLNGTQIATVTIPAGEHTATTDPDITVDAGDYLTVDIAQAGTSEPGRDLVVTITITEGVTP